MGPKPDNRVRSRQERTQVAESVDERPCQDCAMLAMAPHDERITPAFGRCKLHDPVLRDEVAFRLLKEALGKRWRL